MEHAEKEKWIAQTMGSIDQISCAEANPFLYSKVMQRWENRASKNDLLKPRLAWAAVAMITLLIGLNVVTCINLSKTNTAGMRGTKAFASEYFQFMNSNEQF